MWFTKGGAIEFGKAMLDAGRMGELWTLWVICGCCITLGKLQTFYCSEAYSIVLFFQQY